MNRVGGFRHAKKVPAAAVAWSWGRGSETSAV